MARLAGNSDIRAAGVDYQIELNNSISCVKVASPCPYWLSVDFHHCCVVATWVADKWKSSQLALPIRRVRRENDALNERQKDQQKKRCRGTFSPTARMHHLIQRCWNLFSVLCSRWAFLIGFWSADEYSADEASDSVLRLETRGRNAIGQTDYVPSDDCGST